MRKIYNKTIAEKNREKFESAPGLQNLKAVQEQFNRFAPALTTVFNGVNKCWEPGQHIRFSKNGNNCSGYGTLHNNIENFIENKSKYNHTDFKNNTIIFVFNNNTVRLYQWSTLKYNLDNPKNPLPNNPLLATITLVGKGFTYNFDYMNYKIEKIQPGFSELDLFLKTSLLGQCASMHASLGGKAKAAKQAGYKQVRMMFQNKNGECPAEETKSVIDAYKICAKHTKSRKGGGALTLQNFRKKIPITVSDMYDGYKIDCGKFLIYLSFGVSTPQRDECSAAIINNIYKDTDKQTTNFNESVVIMAAEHSVPQMDKPSKDNNKKTTRRSKKLPCGHKTCPINSLLKINKLVKIEKMRKYNQIVTEAIDELKQKEGL